MKREIKFRGLTDYGNIVYGSLTIDAFGNYFIIEYSRVGNSQRISTYNVIPKSVGQFTGLYDKNGVEIYEGDIISYYGSKEGKEIGYSKDGRLVWKVPQGHFTIQVIEIHDEFQMEVIGNIYQEIEVNNG